MGYAGDLHAADYYVNASRSMHKISKTMKLDRCTDYVHNDKHFTWESWSCDLDKCECDEFCVSHRNVVILKGRFDGNETFLKFDTTQASMGQGQRPISSIDRGFFKDYNCTRFIVIPNEMSSRVAIRRAMHNEPVGKVGIVVSDRERSYIGIASWKPFMIVASYPEHDDDDELLQQHVLRRKNDGLSWYDQRLLVLTSDGSLVTV